ncbi:MAG TPA: rod shape-determining protein MreD [Kofleriaceae bacterium]|nr:rod shape-determining protein MreD [Kofleriaceae bacterium]
MTWSRGAAFVALAYVALIVAATLQALAPFHLPLPELGLLVVLYLGLTGRAGAISHVVVALVIGYLSDLFAGSPRGLHALTFGVVMIVARSASSRLMVNSRWQEIVVALFASLAHGALLVAVAAPMYSGDALSSLRLLPMTGLATALSAPFALALFRRLDKRLAPDPRALRMSV